MTDLPKGAYCYKETKPFTPDTLPDKFRRNHHTKAGVWGEISMQSGSLALTRYDKDDPDHVTGSALLEAGERAVFGPQEPHSVAFLVPGSFVIRFYRLDET